MSKDLKEIQEFVRKKVVMACHSECSTYKEALEVELGFGCRVKFPNVEEVYLMLDNKFSVGNTHLFAREDFDRTQDYCAFTRDFKIIGQPLTLTRILNAINQIHGKDYHKMLFQDNSLLYIPSYKYSEAEASFKWKFLNKDRSEALFQDQTEGTQISVARLLGYNK